MKPSNALITAWKEYLHNRQLANAAYIKSEVMFRHSVTKDGVDAELHNRATALLKHGNRLKAHSLAIFRKALKEAYNKRFYIEWRDYQTCTVWVHERYSQDGVPLHFNKSIRCRKGLT